MLPFNEQVQLAIIENGILALVVALVGYWINKNLAAFKHDKAQVLELEKQNRILKNRVAQDSRQRKLNLIERQLSDFYYPIYYRLQKDNAIWTLSPKLKPGQQALPEATNEIIEHEYILQNHQEILSIIETKSHLIEMDDALQAQIQAYVRHITIYQVLRKVDTLNDKLPMDFGNPYPEGFFQEIEKQLNILRGQHDKLLENIFVNE